ncbi:MAG: hypothetical protein ABR538_05655 [Candidatus Binatia bacterium]
MSRARSTVQATPVQGPGQWIVGPSYDRYFLWAAWCVPLVLWAIAVHVPYGLLAALAIFVLLDNSHQVASLPLTIFDPETMKRQAPVYLGGAVAIGTAAIVISFYPETFIAKLWVSLVVYWGAWHIIRQHYGFLRLYQARDKPSSPRVASAEAWALYSGASFPYFLNLSRGWAGESGLGAMIWQAPVPAWSPWVVLAVFVVSFGMVLTDAVARQGPALSRRLLHLVLVVSNFWIGLLWAGRDDLVIAVLFITSYHDLQYHAVVWHVGRKRVAPAAAAVYPAVRRIFASPWTFAAVILVGALVQALGRNDFQFASSLLPESVVTTALFALVTSYSYMHYFFDGKMWKLSKDARLRAELGLGGK